MSTESQERAARVAAYFRKMAERIEHNADDSFGGAYVVAAPSGEEMIEVLILDQQVDEVQFFKMMAEKIRVLMETLDQKARLVQGFGSR